MSKGIKETGIEELSKRKEKPIDLDDVLVNEVGQFGWFQIRNILLLAFPIMTSSLVSEYIFSAAAIPHRCRIPECGEKVGVPEFEPEWILNAVPETSSGVSSCQRYVPRNVEINSTLEYCHETLFDRTKTVACEDFVYAKDNTVVYEFDLGCQDWLRAVAGTLNSVGALLGNPLAGYVSDCFGRKWALIISAFNLGFVGFIRAFSINYTMYLILQILQTTLGGGTYTAAYILATELAGPKYRVLTSTACSTMFALGQVVLGGVAWLIQPWRYMIMAIFSPFCLIIGYYWILPESVRWLLSKKKFAEAKKVLETVGRANNKTINQKSLEALMNQAQLNDKYPDIEKTTLIRNLIRSPVLLRRVCTIPIWWVSGLLIYYGLSINSTSLSDTMYLNYILTCAIEIPGYCTSALVLDKFGRRITLSTGFFLSAICNIAFIFIPSSLSILRIIIYLFGKFCIAMAMPTIYLFTSELYPTEFRHSLVAFSNMIGRIGVIAAPLTPALMKYWHGIPSMLFGGMGILSGVLVLTQPETFGTKLPDTLAEAEVIGKRD